MNLAGVYPVVPTPFDGSGAIDPEDIERLVGFLDARGVDGLVALGALGEGHKLTWEERGDVLRRFRASVPDRLGLVVGVRAPASDPAIALARQAQELGADALLVGPPTIQNDRAIAGYYRRVADAVSIPIIVHDFPSETRITLTAELLAEMLRTIERVSIVKLEDPPTGMKMERVWELAGREVEIFGAYGGLFALEELERGAAGIMTGFAYPELLVELYRRHRAGDLDAAARLFYDIVPLIRFEFQPGIGVHLRKEVLVRRGVFKTATVRHPGAVADATTVAQLFRMVDDLRSKGYELAP